MTQGLTSRYLQYLPAIYQEDPFLCRFLLPFEEVLTNFEDLLSVVDRYFAPALTDPEFLPWLATWVSLVVDEEWQEAKRRRLIARAVGLYRLRGTVEGLKQYIEIYAGVRPELRARRWPGGMQIGVASQIHGTAAGEALRPPTQILNVRRKDPVRRSYYVVDAIATSEHPDVAPGDPLRLYYPADRVKNVEMPKDGTVEIWLHHEAVARRHDPARVTRRDGLVEKRYELTLDTEVGPQTIEYRGDGFLIDEVEQAYRFVLDVQVPAKDLENVKLDKVRAIVDLEKPAHTLYYLKLTPMLSQVSLEPMQVGVSSTIDIDTITV